MNRREFIGGAVATLAAGYANSGVNLLAQGVGDLRAERTDWTMRISPMR